MHRRHTPARQCLSVALGKQSSRGDGGAGELAEGIGLPRCLTGGEASAASVGSCLSGSHQERFCNMCVCVCVCVCVCIKEIVPVQKLQDWNKPKVWHDW